MKAFVAVTCLALLFLSQAKGCEKTTVRGPEGTKLTLGVPASFTVHRGKVEPMQVGLKRENFTDAVTVKVSNLPKGVTARQSSLTVETDVATFVLETAKDADLVANQAVTVTAEGPNDMAATEQIKMTVEE